MLRALALIALVATVAACKDKSKAAEPAATSPSGSAATTTAAPAASPPAARADAAVRPSLPTPLPPPTGAQMTIDDAKAALPAITAKEILGLKQTSDGRQVHGTWCMDGESADDVARQLGKLMTTAGYQNLAIRGDAKKSGVQGTKGDIQMSMVVSASSAANCPAPQHYFASATIFRN